jgi:agmatine deiminase
MSSMHEPTPGKNRLLMPAEWSTHSATMMIWPHNRATWPGKHLEEAELVFRQIIRTLLKYEPVFLFVHDEAVHRRVKEFLGDLDPLPHRCTLVPVPVNDVWARDSGPITVRDQTDGRYLLTDWEFNSWGEKYSPWESDNNLPGRVADRFGLRAVKPGIVLEGGSIETNGEGLFITTETVLLNPNRNPGHSKREIEHILSRYLGAKKIIWLKEGLAGDDTDGHVDDLTRFVNNNTVVTAISDDPKSPNYHRLRENLSILQKSTGLDNNPLHVIPIPMPNTTTKTPAADGSTHLPCSYANFYIANGAVLLPLYDGATDPHVLDLFSALFPGRAIEGIPCSGLVWGQGSIHCITQQLYGIAHKYLKV